LKGRFFQYRRFAWAWFFRIFDVKNSRLYEDELRLRLVQIEISCHSNSVEFQVLTRNRPVEIGPGFLAGGLGRHRE